MSAVDAVALGKCYRRYARPLDRVLEWVDGRTRHTTFWAVEDASFEIEPGTALGLVGDNGAGKSTLLAMVARASVPTTGRIEVTGRIGSILELGAGFHGEFTGRENIFLAGAAQGMTRDDLARRADDIVAFSELGEFIEQPMRTYSSGMFLRLAFSLATAADPDVLVIDEALAVGDQRFQAKCTDKILRFLADGGTLLFCSHNLYQVKKLCDRALWLDHGRVVAYGPAADVCDAYADRTRGRMIAQRSGLASSEARPMVRVTAVRAVDGQGRPLRRIETGEPATVEVWLERDPDADVEPGVAVGIVRSDGLVCYCGSTELDGAATRSLGGDRFYVALHFPSLGLLGGSYHFNVATIDNRRPLTMLEVKEGEAPFSIVNSKADWGVCRLPHVWRDDVEPGRQPAAAEDGRA
ncbi:MAG TPA: ABC transporter ATP-binding protein [Candidatus Binatia bacterium]|nr:ABC transporter ATP-binding protein [Candidatus Binatia bacterium]